MGSGLAAGLMAGAVMINLTMIGIKDKGDGDALFYTALATLIPSLIILWGKKKDILFLNLWY